MEQHYNWQYEFMRPSVEEIVAAYTKIYGKDPLEEDLDDDDSDGDDSAGEESNPADEGDDV